ncbi:TPA: hypothetical protein JLJ31_004049 [Escherichia coli]|nr:hypothetical protein [Escherichia coli]MED9515760.1 hypothetical protein [Escherichia marmotae]EFA5435632.1 hypothetical protein [Escherichia coli]EFN4892153.1 hypothetical protein [Escherichia coli]EJG6432624.1 hypothetical protein [Escherichia coli]
MSEKSLPTAGLGTSTTLTTTLIGISTSLAGFINQDYREAYTNAIPFIIPALSWLILWCYNRFLEPPELAAVRGKLESDLKRLRKIRKDKSLTEEQKKEFDDDYIETQRRIARLGRDYSDGKYQSSGTKNPA